MSSTTELIKSRLDIVDFLRGYLTLTPAGRNFRALCPFHHEKTPSFMVSPERQSWHCFGCNIGGDAFGFLMRYENLDFNEALRTLAEKTGVELRHENPAEYKYSGLLYDLNEQAKDFYKKMLAASPLAQKYLAERGLTAETIETFELGWAPNEPEALSMHLLNSGTAPQDLIQAGLAIKTERGLMLDRFRARLMFPIHNHMGRVVGFTGRIHPQFDNSSPRRGEVDPSSGSEGLSPRSAPNISSGYVPAKYVNSPETPIFQKSKLIYGFWKSKDAVREAKAAVLVEGQMDFLMSWQSGVRNVIASSGTALSADHLRAVHRLAETLIINFDSDVAGSDAAERAIDLAEANDFSVKVVTIVGFKDAAEAAQADPANVAQFVAAAVPAPEFYFQKYLSSDRRELAAREGLLKLRAVLAKLKQIASPVEREFWMKELAKRTGIAERTLTEEAEKIGTTSFLASRPKEGEAEGSSKREISRQARLAEELMAAALAENNPKLLDDCLEYLTPPQKELWQLLAAGQRKSDDPVLDEQIGLIVLRPVRDFAPAEIAALKAELAKEYYKERRRIVAQAVKNAEAHGNHEELAAALEELRTLPVAE
jgi:DNA primase